MWLLHILLTAFILVLALLGAGAVVEIISYGLGISFDWWLKKVESPIIHLAAAIALLFVGTCAIVGFFDFSRALNSR